MKINLQQQTEKSFVALLLQRQLLSKKELLVNVMMLFWGYNAL